MPASAASISAGLSAVKTSFDLTKTLRDLITRQDINPSEVQARLLELQGLLLDAQKALAEADDENRKLRRQLEDQSEAKELVKSLVFAESVYLKRTVEGTLEGPFCSLCWDDSKKLVRLIARGVGKWANSRVSMARFDCILHGTKIYMRPEVLNNVIVK